MAYKLASDFGTTNSIVVHWDEDSRSAKPLIIPGLSSQVEGQPPLIPSLLYLKDGRSRQLHLAMQSAGKNLIIRKITVFFGVLRGITVGTTLEPRLIDGILWTDSDAGW